MADSFVLFYRIIGYAAEGQSREEVMPDDVLTLKEVAEYLKVNERTIYRMVADRKIPGFKVGGSWRFKLTEIEAWIKAKSHEVQVDADDVGEE